MPEMFTDTTVYATGTEEAQGLQVLPLDPAKKLALSAGIGSYAALSLTAP